MKFAEFQAGQVLEAGPYNVREAEILSFAKQWDPQWFHTDPEAASEGPFEGLIASGWHTCSIAMYLVADTFLGGSESFASPGIAYIKWPQPVRPGDTLALKVTVLEARTSSKGRGILRWRWQLFNQLDAEVLDLEATSLFKP
jgi:acyl dehydratase